MRRCMRLHALAELRTQRRRASMLRKEELDLKLGLPGRRAVWPVNIVERLEPNVYGLSADREETRQ